MQNDLRHGVTETQHAVLDELETLRTAMQSETRLRALRQATAFAGIQYATLSASNAADRYSNAVKGAAAMLYIAELLELEGK